MNTVIALLTLLSTLLSGPTSNPAVCETENFEDGSKIEMCYTTTVVCSAWFDAETFVVQGLTCNLK
jgi:hypothetical protein